MAPRSMSCLTSLLLTVTSLCVVTCHGYRLSSVLTKPGRLRREAAGQDDQVPPSQRKVRYGVLLDAGSSSTKVKVYSFAPAQSVAGVPHVRLEKSQRERPGLGSFVSAPPGQLREYLDKVLSHATEVVPRAQHATSPVYIMATAGMRVLGAMEAKELLQEVGRVMQNSSLNPFVFHQQHVNILSGEEEAVYAWLAVNYLRGFFSEDSPHPPESVGVLEMGGGSMQVAFLPDTPLYQEEFQMYVGRRRFDLYAQTYLSYGSNYLTEQVRWRLLERQEKRGLVSDMRFYSPCMLSDDTAEFQWENQTYQVQGTGNTSHCEEVLASILAPVDSILCSPGPCTIRDTYQPAVGDHPFYAISAFLYAPRSLKAVKANGELNITKLRHNARDYCRLTVDQAVKQTGTKAKFASNDCLMGLYIPLLLTSALGFNLNTRTITVASKINDTSIDWALGAMVQRLSMTFMNDPDSLSYCHLRDRLPENRSVRIHPSSGSCPLTSSLTLLPFAVLILGCTRLISWQ